MHSNEKNDHLSLLKPLFIDSFFSLSLSLFHKYEKVEYSARGSLSLWLSNFNLHRPPRQRNERRNLRFFSVWWKSLCLYVTKEDKSPHIWGKYTLSEILEEAKAAKSQRKPTHGPKAGEGKTTLGQNRGVREFPRFKERSRNSRPLFI